MTAYVYYEYRLTTYDHVLVDANFLSEEHSRITIHEGSGFINAYQPTQYLH